MKNILLSLLLMCIASTAAAQTKVYGIPVATTRAKYVLAMKKKGLAKYTKRSNELVYKVKFAGHENCELGVRYNVETDSVTSVNIHFPYDTYKQCDDTEWEIRDQIKAKYGEMESSYSEYDRYRGMTQRKWYMPDCKIVLYQEYNKGTSRQTANSLELVYYTNATISRKIIASDDL